METLKSIVTSYQDDLINYWLEFFPEEEKEEEYRYYDDFLGFFEECLDSGLSPDSEEAHALAMFLEKIIELIGEDHFFNFKDSVYTCYLKFPIFKKLNEIGEFKYEIVEKVTSFFESLTSKLIVSILKKNREIQDSSLMELEEREAPISEIWDGVLMVSVVGTLDSNRVLKIIDKILLELEKKEIRDVIIDINSIYDVNSEVAKQLVKLNNAIHFMGSYAYLAGITPSIAKSLTNLNINLGDIKTFSSTRKAMRYILDGRE